MTKRLKRTFQPDPSCVLYLPLYDLDGVAFQSREHYGRLCTPSGAFWTPQGWSFDATNDYITLTAIQPMPIVGTISIWAYKANWAGGGTRILFNVGATDNQLLLYRVYDNTARLLITTATVDQVDINSGALSGAGWKYFEVLYGLNNTSLFINQIQIGSTDTVCTMPTFAAGWVTRLGNSYAATTSPFDGIIGEIIIHGRQLTLPERTNQYLATSWRYK